MRRDMNHCVLEVEVREAPTIRYTQDNQTPIAEMTVTFDGLRQDDAPGELKVVGWGNLAQDLQNRVSGRAEADARGAAAHEHRPPSGRNEGETC